MKLTCLLVAAAASLLPTALAQEPSAPKRFAIIVDSEVAPSSHEQMRYPTAAGLRDLDGACRVSFVVDATGRADGMEILSCSSDIFRRAAGNALAAMRFEANAPVDRIEATIRWQIEPGATTLRTASID
jgi:TonB family protein